MGKFNFITTEVPGLIVIEPTVFGDHRGFFMETYHRDEFAAAGISEPFVQDNHSMSTKGVFRGLHFQREHTQGKLVRVIRGSVYDVGVDVRPGSATFGHWVGVELSEENKRQFYVPAGFAHGFLVTSDVAEFTYKCTDIYDPSSDGGIRFDDPKLAISWPDTGVPMQLSEKDRALPGFAEQDFSCFERWL